MLQYLWLTLPEVELCVDEPEEVLVDDPDEIPWLAELSRGVSVDGPLGFQSFCWEGWSNICDRIAFYVIVFSVLACLFHFLYFLMFFTLTPIFISFTHSWCI